MADDYTPTTDMVREDFGRSLLWPAAQSPDRTAAFDRWLATLVAEKRAEWEAEQLPELRAARAETWDEAIAVDPGDTKEHARRYLAWVLEGIDPSAAEVRDTDTTGAET